MTIGEAYEAVHGTSNFFCNAVSHPPPPQHRDIKFCDNYSLYQFKNYLKWQVIQLAIEWRVGPLKDYR